MLVSDLRKIIEKYDSKEKDKIIVELYKRIPKDKKEDYDIDGFILEVNKKPKKDVKIKTIEELASEVNYFIECANNNLYVQPNKIISKSDRSKWRFKVKNFYKELNNFIPGTYEGDKATDLLVKLFKILSYGTHYLTFSNWETFRAIQISQSEFYDNIIKRKFSSSIDEDKILYCIDLLNVEFDPYEYHRSMLHIFESNLKTIEMKEKAIELLKEQVIKTKERLRELKKDNYELREKNKYFVECIIDIYFELGKVNEGISYFHKNNTEATKEVKEYILLEKIEEFEFIDEWILEYEKHLGKIDYRDSLKEKYNKFKKNNY